MGMQARSVKVIISGASGVDRGIVNQIERGKRIPHLRTLTALAGALGLTLIVTRIDGGDAGADR